MASNQSTKTWGLIRAILARIGWQPRVATCDCGERRLSRSEAVRQRCDLCRVGTLANYAETTNG